MDIAAALLQIDSVIGALESARAILIEVAGPAPVTPRQLRSPRLEKPQTAPDAVAPPQVTVIPPKVKREYSPRQNRLRSAAEPRSLSSAVPAAPVFVPRPALSSPPPEPAMPDTEQDVHTLESIMRRKLLGVVA